MTRNAKKSGPSHYHRRLKVVDELGQKRKLSNSQALDEVERLADVLERIVVSFSEFVKSSIEMIGMASRRFDGSDLARALLLVDKGEKFRPAILRAIREYRMAHENVERYRNSSLPEPERTDILARFRQQLDLSQQTLQLLQVTVVEPKIGEFPDGRRHLVIRTVHCDDPEKGGRIASVVCPGFEWSDDQGNRPNEPAEVSVYKIE